MPPPVICIIPTLGNTFKPTTNTIGIVVRMGPAIFVRVRVLITRFKGIYTVLPKISTGGFTNPTKIRIQRYDQNDDVQCRLDGTC